MQRAGPCVFMPIGCSGDEASHVGALCPDELRQAWLALHTDLDLKPPPGKVSVYYVGLHADRRTLPDLVVRSLSGRRKTACWITGHEAIVIPARARENLGGRLVHELAHGALEHAGAPSRLPLSLCEGYAMCGEDRFASLGNGRSRLSWAIKGFTKALSSGHTFSYDLLCRISVTDLAKESRYTKAVFYAQSMLLVKFVLTHPVQANCPAFRLLCQISPASNAEPAARIAELFGFSVDAFADKYLEFCEGHNYGSPD